MPLGGDGGWWEFHFFLSPLVIFMCRKYVPLFLRDSTLPGCQDKLQEAEPLQRSALSIGERMLGTNHSDVATYYNNLSRYTTYFHSMCCIYCTHSDVFFVPSDDPFSVSLVSFIMVLFQVPLQFLVIKHVIFFFFQYQANLVLLIQFSRSPR